MSIVSSETIADSHTQSDGTRYVTHYFTDHLGGVTKRGPHSVAGSDTETEYAVLRAGMEQSILNHLANQEIQAAIARAEQGLSVDAIPDHQTQAEFDRRVLGRMMLIGDAHTFHNAYSFLQAVELRGGANANQRASYLSVSTADYNLIDTRFGNVNGVAWFLADEKNQIWSELPEAFE